MAGTVVAAQVKVKFNNDGTSSSGGDKNLYVNWIEVDGNRYESEAPETYSTGTWTVQVPCTGGQYPQSEKLHCNGYFQYDQGGATATPSSPTATPPPSSSPTATATSASPTPTATPPPPAPQIGTRITYRLAGQIVAIRTILPDEDLDIYYFTYLDHLGSIVGPSYTGGAFYDGSLARFDPFGNFVNTPSTNPSLTNMGFTGHRHNNTGSNDLGLIYKQSQIANARYYVPEVGRFASPDTLVPDPSNPQSFNRYSYSYNNPVNYTDSSGHCPAPVGSTGQVLCIDLFISSEFVDPFGFGYGDNRSFDTDSNPGQSRAYMYIYLNENGGFQRAERSINTSCTRIGCFGPELAFDSFEVTAQDNGDLQITWDLLNGVSGELRALSDVAYVGEAENGLMALASSGVYLASLPLAAINGEMVLSLVDGRYQIANLNRDPFPSLEAYAYQDGQYAYTLAQLMEHGLGPFWGLSPIASNERYNSPVWYSQNNTLLLNGSSIPD